MAGLTLDTGALIGFERADRRVLVHLKNAQIQGCELTVPTVVIAEAWRGGARSARVGKLLQACVVEPLFEDIARIAGEAMGATRGSTVADAIVVASAAARGDRILTTDFDDLDRLRSHFPSVRLLTI
jgi:predicted nucleic acid-binding protein